ncbi:MAG: MBL fold metallo-hydrolase [Cyclobacteriaceae bacterium]
MQFLLFRPGFSIIILQQRMLLLMMISLYLSGCQDTKAIHEDPMDMIVSAADSSGAFIMILGTVQDAGSPQIACQKACCIPLYSNPDFTRKVVSLGLIDSDNNRSYLFEATPDIASQLDLLRRNSGDTTKSVPDGVFLTHAHIGHYTGLMYLGAEAMNATEVPVYAAPKMREFLSSNGPWDQLVSYNNLSLQQVTPDSVFDLSSQLRVKAFRVPHRDEYSETVGWKIYGPHKSALFIPDIDKWEKWDTDITEVIKEVDYAFLDATFYDNNELKNRDMSEIPHPFVVESMMKFSALTAEQKQKIYFIYFNHTNPLFIQESVQSKKVLDNGFGIARFGERFVL